MYISSRAKNIANFMFSFKVSSKTLNKTMIVHTHTRNKSFKTNKTTFKDIFTQWHRPIKGLYSLYGMMDSANSSGVYFDPVVTQLCHCQ